MKRTILLTACIMCLIIAAWSAAQPESGKANRFASERSAHPFVGATRVMIEGFDPSDKDATSATMQFDKNQVSYSMFGDSEVTAVFYKPIEVKLKRIENSDPAAKGRLIYTIEIPKDAAEDLGKNTLRLVTGIGAKSERAGIRLLLISPEKKVIQTLELRPSTI